MSMTILMVPKFHFEGNWNAVERAFAIKNYEIIRSVWVRIFNEHIQSFNDDFDMLHPGHGKLEAGSAIEKEYYEFIRSMMMPYDSELNEKKAGVIFTIATSDDCCFELINKNGGKVYCTYEMI